MLIVPLQAVPNQTVRVQMNGQLCQVNVYQKPAGLFMDLLVDNSPMVMGVICERNNRIVRDAYLGFVGDMAWIDTQAKPTRSMKGSGRGSSSHTCCPTRSPTSRLSSFGNSPRCAPLPCSRMLRRFRRSCRVAGIARCRHRRTHRMPLSA